MWPEPGPNVFSEESMSFSLHSGSSPLMVSMPHIGTEIPAELRERYVPGSILRGEANLLIFPNLESANLSMTLLKALNDALAVGPILMGTRQPAHILAPSVTSRGVVNMAAIAASEASAGPLPVFSA